MQESALAAMALVLSVHQKQLVVNVGQDIQMLEEYALLHALQSVLVAA
jgi:hypothetical protein